MQEFFSGPFLFSPAGRPVNINGASSQKWELSYAGSDLAMRTIDASATKDAVAAAFDDAVAAFVRENQPLAEPAADTGLPDFEVALVESISTTGSYGKVLGEFTALASIPGLTSGMLDDRYPTWLITRSHPMRAMPMSIAEFERLKEAHEAIAAAAAAIKPPAVLAPRYAWVAGLLPDEVLTIDPDEWRAPSSWEIRHIVGEGSFTRVTGAAAARLVGVNPQSFRKYTARDDARSRQTISFAMWHLLLHRLGVQVMESVV